MTSSSNCMIKNEDKRINLQAKLLQLLVYVESSFCCSSFFNVVCDHLGHHLIKSDEDVRQWCCSLKNGSNSVATKTMKTSLIVCSSVLLKVPSVEEAPSMMPRPFILTETTHFEDIWRTQKERILDQQAQKSWTPTPCCSIGRFHSFMVQSQPHDSFYAIIFFGY